MSDTFHGITPGMFHGKIGPGVGGEVAALPFGNHATLSDDILSWWRMDEESGTRADEAGSNDLTDNNTVLFTEDGLIGNAATFESGNSESLSKASFSSLSAYTVSLWYRTDTDVTDGSLVNLFDNWVSTLLIVTRRSCLFLSG